MRVLVLFGSKRGGTQGIAETIGSALRELGLGVDVLPPGRAKHLERYQAAIVGGALYANHWPLRLRWYVRRHAAALRRMPVWSFSSGPLDDGAEREEIAPTESVRALLDRILARRHATFGGRLSSDVRGFPASAMAKEHSGDWRNEALIRAWAIEIGRGLAQFSPTDQPSAPA
jgi:menaquinone-dependent protoporphyrinogen oxidase